MEYPKLENGLFGKLNNGKKFVVVDNVLVFQDGTWADVNSFNERLICKYASVRIDKLVKLIECFDLIDKEDVGVVIFRRE